MRERPKKNICTHVPIDYLYFFMENYNELSVEKYLNFMTGTRNLCRITRNVELDVI